MNFVTKKEFEDAVKIIQKALNNRQVKCGYNDTVMEDIAFVSGDISGGFLLPTTQTSFIPSDMAIKNRLHNLRNELKISRENADTQQKQLEKLEKEEKALTALLPTLKE